MCCVVAGCIRHVRGVRRANVAHVSAALPESGNFAIVTMPRKMDRQIKHSQLWWHGTLKPGRSHLWTGASRETARMADGSLSPSRSYIFAATFQKSGAGCAASNFGALSGGRCRPGGCHGYSRRNHARHARHGTSTPPCSPWYPMKYTSRKPPGSARLARTFRGLESHRGWLRSHCSSAQFVLDLQLGWRGVPTEVQAQLPLLPQPFPSPRHFGPGRW